MDRTRYKYSSSANYILIGGHFPVYSAGVHGNTQCLIDKLKPILEEYEVTAFLAGHDHNNQVREAAAESSAQLFHRASEL